MTKVRYSGGKAIKPGMTDSERYEILKKTKITVVTDNKSDKQPLMKSIESIPERAKGQVEKYIRDLADELKILNTPLSTTDLDIEFQISKNNGLRESLSQQLKYGGNYRDFSRALINLKSILENAVLVHSSNVDRYAGTVRETETFVATHVLLGAFRNGESIIPVKLEIKQNRNIPNNLYLVVAMTKIKETDVKGSAHDDGISSNNSLPGIDPIYSIPQIVSKINPRDGRFFKNLPDQMLTPEQKAAKEVALAEDAAKLDRLKQNAEPTGDSIPENNSGKRLSIGSASNDSISQKPPSVNSKSEKERHSSTPSGHGTRPRNDAEKLNRIKAQEMLARGEDSEAVYNATGWYVDKFGNLVVDHKAPVYDTSTVPERIMNYAERMEAAANKSHAESLSLRADMRRAERAIKSDSKAVTKPDRELLTDALEATAQNEKTASVLPNTSVVSFMGYLKEKSILMIFDGHSCL